MLEHSQPPAHHADDHQHHHRAQRHRQQRPPGDAPLQRRYLKMRRSLYIGVRMSADSVIREVQGARRYILTPERPRTILYTGFIKGNKITSRMLSAPVSIMTSRSMPSPMPPAGGMP